VLFRRGAAAVLAAPAAAGKGCTGKFLPSLVGVPASCCQAGALLLYAARGHCRPLLLRWHCCALGLAHKLVHAPMRCSLLLHTATRCCMCASRPGLVLFACAASAHDRCWEWCRTAGTNAAGICIRVCFIEHCCLPSERGIEDPVPRCLVRCTF